MIKAVQEAIALTVSLSASSPTSVSISDKTPSVSQSEALIQRRHVHF